MSTKFIILIRKSKFMSFKCPSAALPGWDLHWLQGELFTLYVYTCNHTVCCFNCIHAGILTLVFYIYGRHNVTQGEKYSASVTSISRLFTKRVKCPSEWDKYVPYTFSPYPLVTVYAAFTNSVLYTLELMIHYYWSIL